MVTHLDDSGNINWDCDDICFFDAMHKAEDFVTSYFNEPEVAGLDEDEQKLFIFECSPLKRATFTLVPQIEMSDIKK